jgi:hypothetical protein
MYKVACRVVMHTHQHLPSFIFFIWETALPHSGVWKATSVLNIAESAHHWFCVVHCCCAFNVFSSIEDL